MTGALAEMSSKVVDRTLRELFWPKLATAGFTRRSGRTAWRDVPGAIQVANIQSFNSYLAEVLGSTTYSFSVNLGVFLGGIAERSRMTRFVRDRVQPREMDCHVRMSPVKGVDQSPATMMRELGQVGRGSVPAWWKDRTDLWYVLPNGANLEAVVRDASAAVLEQGLPWLDAMSDPGQVLRALRERPDQHDPSGKPKEMYGGTIGSPGRWQKIGALAAALGDRPLLAEAVAAMSEQDYWKDWPEDLETLRAALSGMS